MGKRAWRTPIPHKVPARPCGRTGTKWGMGVRHALFPMLALGAPAMRCCQLPDAILHGKRSHRPRSRAVQHLADTGLLSEAFQLAWTGGCATGSRTRPRHVCNFLSASRPLSAGSATVFDGALARCHGSRLLTLRLPLVHRPAVSFVTPPTFRRVFTGPAQTACPSRFERSLCLAFRRLSFG